MKEYIIFIILLLLTIKLLSQTPLSSIPKKEFIRAKDGLVVGSITEIKTASQDKTIVRDKSGIIVLTVNKKK